MHVAFVSLVAGLAALYFGLRQWLRATQDSREPPVLGTTIPFVTPIVGTLADKMNYYTRLRDQYNLPIYTLRLLGSRIYVINTPQLITAVQKNFKVLTFQKITDKFSGLICDTSEHAKDVQKKQHDLWAEGKVAESGNHKSYKVLSPGIPLDEMNRTMIASLAGEVEKAFQGGAESVQVGLYQWLKDIVTIATTDGVYGAKNPYRDPKVSEDYWIYESALPIFAIGIKPKLLARAGHEARSRNALVFERYFQSGDYLQGSTFTTTRHAWHIDSGFQLSDIARLEVGNGIAILSNTVPTAFWALYHILIDPSVLSAVRTELQQHVETSSEGKYLDIAKVKNNCPLLFSSMKESMRLHSLASGVRSVLQDTLLNNTYLLKKDSMVLMPSTVQHSDPHLWGEDVHTFNYARFANTSNSRAAKVNPVSFRAFGGGTTLCPGRHFATTEVLALVAMVVLRFEVEPTEGRWKELLGISSLTAAMPKPDGEVEVRIREIEEEKGVRWKFGLSVGGRGIAIAAEDLVGEKV